MQKINLKKDGDILTIGENPQLIVNLKSQENFIKVEEKTIPYHKEIAFSNDLLSGKRENVLNTALAHYYRQACAVAEGMKVAEQYRSIANTTVREVK